MKGGFLSHKYMNQKQKDLYLKQAKQILDNKRQSIAKEIKRIPEESLKIKDMQHGSSQDRLTYETIIRIYRKRFNDLRSLYPSPYFYACQVKFKDEDKYRWLYFSKFSFDNEHIYSWTSPVAQIRFEQPGSFSFKTEDQL